MGGSSGRREDDPVGEVEGTAIETPARVEGETVEDSPIKETLPISNGGSFVVDKEEVKDVPKDLPEIINETTDTKRSIEYVLDENDERRYANVFFSV